MRLGQSSNNTLATTQQQLYELMKNQQPRNNTLEVTAVFEVIKLTVAAVDALPADVEQLHSTFL